jgi:hypothetical protein
MGWLANFLIPPKQNQIKFLKKKKKGLWVNCPFLPPLKPRNANPVEVTKQTEKRGEYPFGWRQPWRLGPPVGVG